MEKDIEIEIERPVTGSSEAMRAVKGEFMAMKNGVVADALRKGGAPFRLIFGLNLPQIAEIAAQRGVDSTLAEELWANTGTRESMLLAPMLADAATFSLDDARRWCATVPCVEVADVLCHRLLRHLPFAAALADEILVSGTDMSEYIGLRIYINIWRTSPAGAERAARSHVGSGCRRNAALAADLLDRVCPNA